MCETPDFGAARSFTITSVIPLYSYYVFVGRSPRSRIFIRPPLGRGAFFCFLRRSFPIIFGFFFFFVVVSFFLFLFGPFQHPHSSFTIGTGVIYSRLGVVALRTAIYVPRRLICNTPSTPSLLPP